MYKGYKSYFPRRKGPEIWLMEQGICYYLVEHEVSMDLPHFV